ncbi:TnsD family Tn7-like transposition protein [Halobacillus ihumii]|uniref:TnsD family Tn7-like transposition protein n=1 Tax=Halobacillus ihumii TaxID=2686092 RepID=UPI0013D4758A|nr:TnsD family Tn7-like transposition protein [Halobacillus ihumii]
MLSFFPTLYDDELLYSGLARYHVRSCNFSPKTTMKDLFGSASTIAVPDLLTHLEKLYEQVQHFRGPTINEWIQEHTFFHYYTEFAKKQVKEQVYNAMATGNKPGAIHMMTGMMASNISEPSYFRFCPHCVGKDIECYGETFWHLSHQLPGVLVCLKHETLLQDSNVPFRGPNKHKYIAATKENCGSTVNTSVFNNQTMSHLKQIAKDSIQLAKTDFSFNWQGIQQAYHYLLQKHGYATVKGTVDQRELAEQFKHYYGEELLKALQSAVDADHPSCWLKAITRKHRKAFHPIRHLLLIHFFGETVSTFYQYASRVYQPFGEAPYPCLNAAASHYLKPVISNVKITICTDTRRPVGTFTCSCGFCYSRRGPDQADQNRYKIGRIKQFGSVWKEKLHRLVHVEKLSYYAVAKQLKVDIGTVKKYANQRSRHDPIKIVDSSSLLPEKRAKWLRLQQQYSTLSITELRKVDQALYTWLYRHDQQWLDRHSPRQKSKPSENYRVDWPKRDQEVLKEVQTAVQQLHSIRKPIHINIGRIGKQTGRLALLERHLEKMPETKAYLKQVVETREQFQMRRVKWAAQQLSQGQEEVVEWKIQRLAGLRDELPDCVQQEISLWVQRYQTKARKEV